MTPSGRRPRVTPADVLLVMAALALAAAMAYPRVERAALWRQVEKAQADVEAVLSAATAYRRASSDWPEPSQAGAIPTGLAGHLPAGFSFRSGSYTLEWSRWETVETAEPDVVELPPGDFEGAPPPPDSVPDAHPPVQAFGTVTVHADDERLLAALLERFGASRSFLRERSWTLVLPPGGGG